MVEASPGFSVAFVATVALVAGLVIAAHGGARAAAAVAVWLAFSTALAASGVLVFEPVPTIMIMLVLMIALVLLCTLRAPGARILERVPLVWLVGYQAFRIPVELLLHRAHGEGIVPIQMTYLGWNFDVLTGISAIAVAALLARGIDRATWSLRVEPRRPRAAAEHRDDRNRLDTQPAALLPQRASQRVDSARPVDLAADGPRRRRSCRPPARVPGAPLSPEPC